jgi:hypothetical protein
MGKVSTYLKALLDLQKMMINENFERIESSESKDDWDLIEKIIITPSCLQMETTRSTMEFDENLNIKGRVKRRRKR